MFYLFVIALLLSIVLNYIILKGRPWISIMDIPNERSSHRLPVPKGGGVGIMLVFFGIVYFFKGTVDQKTNSLSVFLIATSIIFAISLLDDIKDLSIKIRLGVHILASLILCFSGMSIVQIDVPVIGNIEFGVLSIPLTIMWLVGMTNLYNFMDGIDGLAGGQAVIASIFLYILSVFSGNQFAAIISIALCGASLGFCIFNFPPAKIFMGDTGSASIGFIFGALAIQASQVGEGEIPFAIFMLLLGTFIFDTSLTLCRRVVQGEKWFVAHRSHFYQRLLVLNYSHFDVTVFELITAFILGGFALLYYFILNDVIRLFLLLVLLSVFMLFAKAVTQMEKNVDSFGAKKLKGFLDLIHSFNRHSKASD